MNFSLARWALAHLDAWTWLVAEYRVWLIVILTVIGVAAPFLGGSGKYWRRPAPSVVIRSAAMALGFSAAAVTACSLLHFTDLRWLAPGQRGIVHLNPLGGLLSVANPVVGVVNSVAGLPVEFRAVQASVHVAITCAFLALAALLVVALTSRRARRADIRQIVREEIHAEADAGPRREQDGRSAPCTST